MDKYIVTHLQPLWWLRGKRKKKKEEQFVMKPIIPANTPKQKY